MKKVLFHLISAMLVSITAILQVNAQDKAFYIYRNDGHFNAFFNNDVDSIVYSRISIDSVTYDDYVVQEVYTTDSIYRIPLAAIDSVGFIQPKIVYKSNVRKIEDELRPYLLRLDGMKLVFSSNIPQNIYPHKEDILLCFDFEDSLFQEGFAGRIVSIKHDNDSIIAECDSLTSLTDVFEQFIAIEEIGEDNNLTRSSVKRIEGNFSTDPFKIRVNKDFPVGDYGKIGLNFGYEWKAQGVYKITLFEEHIEVTFNQSFDTGVDLSLSGKIEGRKSWSLPASIAARFPVQCPIFKAQLSPYLFIKGKVELELSASLPNIRRTNTYVWTYHNGVSNGLNIPDKNPIQWEVNFDPQLSLKGDVQAGVWLQFYVGTVKFFKKWYMGTSLDMYIGPKFEGELSIDLSKLAEPSIYDLFKDSKVSFSPLSLDISASGWHTTLFTVEEKEHEFFNIPIDFFKTDFYLFPDFSEITLDNTVSNSVSFTTTPTRNVLFPQTLGFGVYDVRDNKLIYKKYNDERYGMLDNHNTYTLPINGVAAGFYTVRPLIKILTFEDIPASPDKGFNVNSPVKIEKVEVTKASYYPNHYTYNGKKYSFQYKCSITATVEEDENIEEWGYMYEDPDGNKVRIPLTEFGSSYTDARYAYCRNESKSTIKLYGYVKYKDDEQIYYSEPQEFDIEYPEDASVTLTSCNFLGTDNNVTFEGKTYKYKSSYKYYFKASGAYWLKVGTEESGTGWNLWELPNYTTLPVDGSNALTVNYYYDDKEFAGDYNVYLEGVDATHSKSYKTTNYVTYTYSDNQFTGCTFNSSSATRQMMLSSQGTEQDVYNIVINKFINK